MSFCTQCKTYLASDILQCPTCGTPSPQTTSLSEVWTLKLEDVPTSAPVSFCDRLFVPTRKSGPNSWHAALHLCNLADGGGHSKIPFKYASISGLAVMPNDTLLVSTSSTDFSPRGTLFALDVEGKEQWHWPSLPEMKHVSSPVLIDGHIYVIANLNTMVCLDVATGEERKRVTLPEEAFFCPFVADQGIAIIPCQNSCLLAISLQNGDKRWQFNVPASTTGRFETPPIVFDSYVFAALTTGEVFALHLDNGECIWQVHVGPPGMPLTEPSTDGIHLFVGAEDGVYALMLADGSEVWNLPTERKVAARPIIAGGVVYVTGHDHYLYALDASTGQLYWRYAVASRIEVPPVLVTNTETNPCIIIAGHDKSVTVIKRSICAVEYETAGRWVEAASAYAEQGNLVYGAKLLETHHEPLKAAELWMAAGETVRAVEQYEIAGEWGLAAKLWETLGEPLRQVKALENYALVMEKNGDREACVNLWEAASEAYKDMWELEQSVRCQREIARCLQHPIITVDLESKELVLYAQTLLKFTVRNEGFGPARLIVIRASHDLFEGEITETREMKILKENQQRTCLLNIRPNQYGDSVPLHLQLKYLDGNEQEHRVAQTIYLPVAQKKSEQYREVKIATFITQDYYRDLEIRIFERDQEGYPVEITLDGQQHFSRGYLSDDILDWNPTDNIHSDGSRLFEMLFDSKPLRNAWAQASGQSYLRRVRLWIDPGAPELHSLPWEMLCENEIVLSSWADTPFSRYLPTQSVWRNPLEERPIRVLIAISNPKNLADYQLVPLDVEKEQDILFKAFSKLPKASLQLDFLSPPITLSRLAAKLQDEEYHILHYLGHGEFNQRKQHAGLYLQNEHGDVQIVYEETLREMLSCQIAPPYLVFLATCQSATRSTADAFRGLGPQLINAGIPAVVAMQDKVSATTTQTLSNAFYRRLTEHGVVDLALNEARNILLTSGHADAAVPVLFMRLKDGRLFARQH